MWGVICIIWSGAARVAQTGERTRLPSMLPSDWREQWGEWGAICLIRSGGARVVQRCKHFAPINVAILLERAAGKGGWWWGAICIIRSGRGARAAQWYRYFLPSIWPGFRFQRRRHILVEFLVASLPCSEKIFPQVLRFSPLLKNQQWQTLIRFGTHGHVQTSS